MKYSKELHDELRIQPQSSWDKDYNQEIFIALLDEIDRLNAERRWIPVDMLEPYSYGDMCEFRDKNGAVYRGYWNCGFISREENGTMNCEIPDVVEWRPFTYPAPESEG